MTQITKPKKINQFTELTDEDALTIPHSYAMTNKISGDVTNALASANICL